MDDRRQPRAASVLLSVIVLAPGIWILAIATQHAMETTPRGEVPCWLLPNLQVLEIPTAVGCPLRMSDQIEYAKVGATWTPISTASELRDALPPETSDLSVRVRRGGDREVLTLPVVYPSVAKRTARIAAAGAVFAAFVGLPLLLLWRSRAAAGLPLTLFYATTSTVAVTVIASPQSDTANRIMLVSLIFSPAALCHLALYFPRIRAITQSVPTLAWLPYAVSTTLVPVGFIAVERDPILWAPYTAMLMALTTGAWAIVMLSCRSAMLDARSSSEFARARLVLVGAILLPLIPTLSFLSVASGPTALASFYLWSLPATLPLPVGLAISRYNLFDLESDLRASVANAAYVGLTAVVLTLVLSAALAVVGSPAPLADLSILFLASLVSMVALEPLRRLLPTFVEGALTPRLNELRNVRSMLADELATLGHADKVLERTASALRTGIGSESGALWIYSDGIWGLAHLWGAPPPAGYALLEEARLNLEGVKLSHLAALEDPHAQAPGLTDSLIEVIAPIATSDEILGMLLLGPAPRRTPYSGIDIAFIESITATAGVALENTRLAEELVAAQDQAAVGRVALGIAHDLGKELKWISAIADRLPEHLDDVERAERDADLLIELSDGILGTFDRFLRHYNKEKRPGPENEQPTPRPLDQLVEQAVRRVEHEHHAAYVESLVEPSARTLACHPALARAVFNLLDNALHASPPGQGAQLTAGISRDGALRIDIEDRGPGIPKAQQERVFTPGFSTRKDEGGNGIGLTIASDITRALGGSLKLEGATPSGTRARLRLPLGPLDTRRS